MAGRVKVALAKRLGGLSVEIDPDELQTTERLCRDAGGASWTGRGWFNGKQVWVYSFCSMSECLRLKDLKVVNQVDSVEVV